MSNQNYYSEGPKASKKKYNLILLGVTLVLIGVTTIIVTSIVYSGSTNIGGIIMIGPIPIVFGTDIESIELITVGTILTIISVTVFLISNKRADR